ncbi:MAG: T9SS type A sorting domain-containing protein [Saprospiraceae bacterium]|nr:T9SS type A sorting domain-containing protein [Saprospiraceae bacterium]HRG69589.1 T9SS type A sorting domain-containing protein [Saprospiraceae bacterium]
MKKQITIIYLSLFWIFGIQAQFDKFLITSWNYEIDNISTDCFYYSGVTGSDRIVGHDYEFIRYFKKNKINSMIPDWQLFKPQEQRWNNNPPPSKVFLDNSRDLDIKMLVKSPDLTFNRSNPVYNQTNSQGALNYFGNHSGILGYFVIDEPNASHFSYVASYFSDIYNFNPNFLRLAGLLPMYADVARLGSPPGTPQDVAYNNYVENYINQTNPNIIAFNSHPLYINNDPNNPTLWPYDFFHNLDIISKKSSLHSLPFVYIPTPIYSPFIIPNHTVTTGNNISQFNYLIFSAMAYGAKGIIYWPTNELFGSGTYGCLNSWDLAITPATFDHLTNIHSEFTENEKIILNCKLSNAYHYNIQSTVKPAYNESIPTSSLWSNITSDVSAMEVLTSTPIVAEPGYSINNILLSFLLDNNNNIYFWVMNKSMSNEQYFHFNFKQTCSVVSFLQNGLYENLNTGVVNLQPGEAKLFSVNKFYSANKTFCNDVYNAVYKDEWANDITLGGTGCSETFSNGSRKNFKARTITLNPGVYINEGASVYLNSYEVKTGTIRAAKKSKEINEDLVENDSSELNKMIVYPNPMKSGNFFVRIDGQDLYKGVKIRILSINNNDVPFNIINFGEYYKIDIPDLPVGIYLIEGEFSGKLHYQKIVKSEW